MAARRKITEEGVRLGMRWIVEVRHPVIRSARATAFVYAFCGPEAFQGCSSVGDVCRRQKVSPRTFRNHLAELSAKGLRWAPTAPALLPLSGGDFPYENREDGP